jgi:hypothetical protein
MLSSRACRLPLGEVFYDAWRQPLVEFPFLTGVTSVDVRAEPIAQSSMWPRSNRTAAHGLGIHGASIAPANTGQVRARVEEARAREASESVNH